jgi:hypothetical protein
MLTPNPEFPNPQSPRSTLPLLAQEADRYMPPGRRGAPTRTQGGGTRLFEISANAEGFVFTPKPNPVPRRTLGSGTRWALSIPRDTGTFDAPKPAPKGDPKAPIKLPETDRQPIG